MSLKRHISYSLVAQVLSAVISFVSSIFITRLLGAEGRGDYTIFTNASAFSVLLFGFSISSTLTYFLNTGKMDKDELFTSSLSVIVLGTLLVSLSLIVLKLFHLTHLVFPDGVNFSTYSILFILNFFSGLTSSVLIALLGAFKLFKQSSLILILFLVIPLVAYLYLYYSHTALLHLKPLDIVLGIVAVNTILSMLAYYFSLRKYVQIRVNIGMLRMKNIQQLLIFTGIAYLANVAQFLTYKMDFWMVDSYRGKQELGIYSLASSLAQMLWIIPNSMGAVLYSQISSEPLHEPLQLKYLRFAPMVMYVTCICAIVGALLSYFLLPVLFGEEFSASFHPLLAFLFGSILFAHSTAIASMNAGRGRFKLNYYGSLLGFGLSVLLYPLCISAFGMMGGAWASSFIYTIQVVFYTFTFSQSEKVLLRELFIIPYKEILSWLKPLASRFTRQEP